MPRKNKKEQAGNYFLNVKHLKMVIGVAIVVLVVAIFFFVPVVPVHASSSQSAGYSPRYETMSCMAFDMGLSYGQNMLMGMSWGMRTGCGSGYSMMDWG